MGATEVVCDAGQTTAIRQLRRETPRELKRRRGRSGGRGANWERAGNSPAAALAPLAAEPRKAAPALPKWGAESAAGTPGWLGKAGGGESTT